MKKVIVGKKVTAAMLVAKQCDIHKAIIDALNEAINYTHSCTELPNECGLLKNINGCDKGSGCRYPNCA